MAEEEILEEVAKAPRKQSGGGMSIVSVLIIVLGLIGVAVGVIFVLSGKNADLEKKMIQEGEKTRMLMQAGGPLEGMHPLDPCQQGDKSVNTIYSLSENPIIVNLADGDTYLSAEFSVCLGDINNKPVDEATFNTRYRDIIVHVLNEILSTKSRADFFPGKEAAGDQAGMGDAVDAFENQGASSFVMSKDQIRSEIKQAMATRAREIPIKDVYITSFLIQ